MAAVTVVAVGRVDTSEVGGIVDEDGEWKDGSVREDGNSVDGIAFGKLVPSTLMNG